MVGAIELCEASQVHGDAALVICDGAEGGGVRDAQRSAENYFFFAMTNSSLPSALAGMHFAPQDKLFSN